MRRLAFVALLLLAACADTDGASDPDAADTAGADGAGTAGSTGTGEIL